MDKKIRKNVNFTGDTLNKALERSKQTDDGNVSAYIRRLIKNDKKTKK